MKHTHNNKGTGQLFKAVLVIVAIGLIYKCSQNKPPVSTASVVDGAVTQVFNLNSLSSTEVKNYTGYGVKEYLFGKRYEGQWYLGKPHGKGTMVYSNDDKYTGDFSNRYRHGEGTMTFASGSVYTGSWNKSKRHGYGTMIYPDGSKQAGIWENGRFLGASQNY